MVLEVVIFLEVASSIGSLNTVILVVFTTALALLILRDVSGKIINGLKESLTQRVNPAPQITSGFFRLIAGLLLFLPGFLTDFIGLLFWLISFNPNILAPLNFASVFVSPKQNRQAKNRQSKNGLRSIRSYWARISLNRAKRQHADVWHSKHCWEKCYLDGGCWRKYRFGG